MSRRTRTLVPTASSLLRPEVILNAAERLKWKRQKAKFYHDRHTKRLPQLEIGQEVRVAPLCRNQLWKQGTCIEKLSDRSYLVRSDGETIKRNRQFLKPAAQPLAQDKPSTNVSPSVVGVSHDKVVRKTATPAKPSSPVKSSMRETVTAKASLPVPVTQKTRTRSVRLPSRSQDFEMKRCVIA